jgi:hypothetical protein
MEESENKPRLNRVPLECKVSRLTKPQAIALKYAIDDRTLEIGGADGRPVKYAVAERLCAKGLLKICGGGMDRDGGQIFIFLPTEKAKSRWIDWFGNTE